MKGWFRLAATRPVGVSILCLAVSVLGFVSLRELSTDLLPEVDVPWITVTTQYEGVAPQEIETLLTRPIEQAVSTVAGVEELQAVSSDGLSRVRMRFDWGVSVNEAMDEVRVAVDRVRRRLPDEAEPPNIFKFDLASTPVVYIKVSGNLDPEQLKHLAEDDLSRALERLAGVASVDARGGEDREIRVALSSERLTALGIRVDEVSAALARENRTVSSGDTLDRGRQVVIRTAGEFESIEDIESTVVATRDQRPVTVADLGRVVDTVRRVRSKLYIDGAPAIELRVFKQSGANTIDVARRVRAEVAVLNQRFDDRLKLELLFDASDFISNAVRGVQVSALLGALLAALVLLLFLRSLRATLVVAAAIPLSVLATFSLIYSQNMTLNLISFGGLALGVGLLVDSAVVILESIYRKRAEGLSALEATVEGGHEVGRPVIAGTLTTMAVFAPVVFVGGLSGVLFSEMAAVVTFSLVCALLCAVTLVPMLSARLLKRPLRQQAVGARWSRFEAGYGRLLSATLDAPWAIVVGSLVLLALSTTLVSEIGVEVMPESDEARVEADIELPVGTPLTVTHELSLEAEKLALGQIEPDELRHTVTSIGPEAWWRPQGSNEAEVEALLVPATDRTRSVQDIERAMREALRELPGAKVRVRPSSANVLNRIIRRGEDRLSIEIRGHDLEAADALAERVVELVSAVPGVTFARPDRELGQPERVIRVDRQRAAELSLGSAEVASAVEHYVLGRVSTRYRDRGDEFDIRVQLEEPEARQLSQLPDLPLITPDGREVPLHAVATLQDRLAPSSIRRTDQERNLAVRLGTAERPLNLIAEDLRATLGDLDVPDGFAVRVGGEVGQQADTFVELLVGVLLALFLVYAAMAVQFESVRQPLVIMLSVPFAFVGVTVMLLATGTTFNMYSFLGVIVLIGIVVNNAIVLVDTTNLLRRRDGLEVREALVAASQRRLRPILMTTLTTLLGLVPLSIGIAEGSEMQTPLARAVVGGLTTSTLVTLLLVPCVYYLVERRRRTSTDRGVQPEAAAPAIAE